MQELSSHTQLIDFWGATRLARLLGVKPSRVARWRGRDEGRGFIPPWYWSRIIELSETHHNLLISYRRLAQLTEHRACVREKVAA